jgi:Lrp/AsnC family transcriptional regulator, regulator for asnA, asnC and gidA
VPDKAGKPAEEVPPGAQPGRGGGSRRIDDLDRRIIKMLQANGRLSNTEVARALDVTETTVRKRIAHLLDENLMSIVAVPSPEAAGSTVSAILGVSVDLPVMQEVAETIKTYPEVRYVGLATGRYDILVEAFFTDQEHLLDFITKRLGALPGVTNLETSIILKVAKFSYEWEIG